MKRWLAAGAAILAALLVCEVQAQRQPPFAAPTVRETDRDRDPPDRDPPSADRLPARETGRSASSSSKSSSASKDERRAPPAQTTYKPEPRDPALVRCDQLRADMEAVIRSETARGASDATRARRQSIYLEQLRSGC